MPKIAKPVSALTVSKATYAGELAKMLVRAKAEGRTLKNERPKNISIPVGTVVGLRLQITPSETKSWILRARVRGGVQREIGLGPFPEVSLAKANELARAAKDSIRAGLDPVAEKRAARIAQEIERARLIWSEAVDRYLATPYILGLPEKQQKIWRATLDQYALPVLGPLPVADIGTVEIKQVLAPIWRTKNETARRVRSRMEAVFNWATDQGQREGENPASQATLRLWIKDQGRPVKDKANHAALAVDDAPAWFAELRTREGMGARALEFVTLTAARSGEVRAARWSEVDFTARTWTIPAHKMKAKREHVVTLSDAAITLLNGLPRFEGTDLIFPAQRGGEMSDMTLSAVMRRINTDCKNSWLDPRTKKPAVPHGLRSTFKDWAIEKTEYPSEMSEIALAHKVGNNVEQAYRRGNMVEKRRAMMEDWGKYLNSGK